MRPRESVTNVAHPQRKRYIWRVASPSVASNRALVGLIGTRTGPSFGAHEATGALELFPTKPTENSVMVSYIEKALAALDSRRDYPTCPRVGHEQSLRRIRSPACCHGGLHIRVYDQTNLVSGQ